jgi:molybdate transport system permease protein
VAARAGERESGWGAVLALRLAAALLLALLTLPIAALFARVPPLDLLARMGAPLVREAMWLSLRTSAAATAAVVVLGVPLAYLLASRPFPGRRLVEALVDLPMVLPPTVAGVGLLLAFGRAGLVGRWLTPLGISIPFTSLAVVLAQAFVSAPLFVNTCRAGFEAVDARYVAAAATLRAGPLFTFRHVVLPLSLPSLLAGAAMTWARALGEFGATITFAGNFPGRTQTMPLAVYIALQTDLEAAVALSVLLVAVSFALLFALRASPWRRP